MKFFPTLLYYIGIVAARSKAATDYCKEPLCDENEWHTACPFGKPHDNSFQSTCPNDAALMQFSSNDKNLILKEHNSKRNIVAGGGLKSWGINGACRVGVMKWDDELQRMAVLHVKSCTFRHDKCRNTIDFRHSGQNIAIQSSSNKALQSNEFYIKKFIKSWYEEYRDVKQSNIDLYYRTTGPKVGHFLVLVNERNIRCGCAAVAYTDPEKAAFKNVMFTCNYATTNIIDSAVYNSCKQPGSKCKSGLDSKFSNLCSTNEVYALDVILEKYTEFNGGVDLWDTRGLLIIINTLILRFILSIINCTAL